MTYEVRLTQPVPTIQLPCSDPTTGASGTATIYAGTALVGPAVAAGAHLYVSGAGVPGAPVGWYVPGARPLASATGVAAWAEVALAQLVINVSGQAVHVHGVSNPVVQLVPGEGGLWPYLTFNCHGSHDLTVTYRVTVVTPPT